MADENTRDTVNIGDSDVEYIDTLAENMPGVPKETIQKWLDEYGNVFRIWFLNEQYVYRNFSYSEYKSLRKKVREEYANDPEGGDEAFKDEIQRTCVLWPIDYVKRLDSGKPNLPGGIPLLIADYILVASGFSDSIVPDIIGPNDQK